MNKHAYTPTTHFRTILCNMLGHGTFNTLMNYRILDQIKQECAKCASTLLDSDDDDDDNMEKWTVRDVARAIKQLGLARYLMYKHEIYYIVTNKPRPNLTKEQEMQMADYFEAHESDYRVGNNYYKFEDIVKNVDEKLGLRLFTKL